MIRVRIYKPAKSAMQAGLAKTKRWILESCVDKTQYTEPLMRWTGTYDNVKQIRIKFDTLEDAVAFAKHNNWDYVTENPQLKETVPKSYAENFRTSLSNRW
jgi:hypothetical protein